mmetsp:Transcript_28369/g.60070  ORF Transcript_28369/g.60070 Transcript_28369/m.60070 type:complete len:501 (+) Transcript_28369:156-1658(+)
MVATMPIIAGGICGLILLCIGGCCLCGFCSIMRNSKKKAADLKAKKKKAKRKTGGPKNGSVVGGEDSRVQAAKQPQQMATQPVQLLDAMQQPQPMLMPPQQVIIPAARSQYAPSGAASLLMMPNSQQSVIHPSATASVAPSVSMQHPHFVVIRDSDYKSSNHSNNCIRESFTESGADDLAASIRKLNATLERRENDDNGDCGINGTHNSKRRSSTGDLTSVLTNSIRRLNDTLKRHENEIVIQQQRRRSMDVSVLSSEFDSDNDVHAEYLGDVEEQHLKVQYMPRSDRPISLDSPLNLDHQWERNKTSLLYTNSSGALNTLGRRASFGASRMSHKTKYEKSKDRTSSDSIKLDSLSERFGESDSIPSFAVKEDDEETGSSSRIDFGKLDVSGHLGAESTKSPTSNPIQSSSIQIGYLGKNEIVDILAPPGVLGLVLDSPDDGWPVIHAVKRESVIADQVTIGNRLMSIDGTDVRNHTSFHLSTLLNEPSRGKKKVTVLRV